VFASTLAGAEPAVIRIWPGVAPGSEGKTAPETVRVTEGGDHVVASVHRPTLTIYLPAKERANGAGVVVIPGGGHRELWMDHEGYAVARWLSERGIAAFILKYRLAREPGSTYTIERDELADAQRALRIVHARAAEWGVDPTRVGVIGFSAGGELAALVSMHNDAGDASASDPIDRAGCKPAFQALIYPGNAASIMPAGDAPPAFLACGYDDRDDISAGIAEVYLRFKKAKIPAELHVFAGVGHGFGIRESNRGPASEWPDRFREWLDAAGFLKSKTAPRLISKNPRRRAIRENDPATPRPARDCFRECRIRVRRRRRCAAPRELSPF
jgi:endo-1,4-beta-xylanase